MKTVCVFPGIAPSNKVMECLFVSWLTTNLLQKAHLSNRMEISLHIHVFIMLNITCIHYVEYHMYSLCWISHVIIMLNITYIQHVEYHMYSLCSYHMYSLCWISHLFIMLHITCIHYVEYHMYSLCCISQWEWPCTH